MVHIGGRGMRISPVDIRLRLEYLEEQLKVKLSHPDSPSWGWREIQRVLGRSLRISPGHIRHLKGHTRNPSSGLLSRINRKYNYEKRKRSVSKA